ncbi:hypothetical protein [Roseisolibacter sp. H3M3-2]|uniref:hypothetical protein n=1 Tax=Roseisolibacter sp. H3M3-2 TaxID=3031323 RepID=UPI0023DCCBD7|nr:hypothetical protein [Roseisolibacter sp. H3M3-2]MDF1502087.1 hypothetical protein [Roseisolibacter sp. H3M3-2]
MIAFRRALARALRAVALVSAVAVAALLVSAHVGTTDAYFDGAAGPYPVRVVVRMPGVIPGQAQVTVRVLDGRAARVFVQAAQWNVGTRGAPAPEPAGEVAGAPGTFAAPLWLMTRSSYMVNVTVDGPAGRGTAAVPVVAQATARLGMAPWMGWMLAVLGVLLVAGLLTLVFSAVRAGARPPGERPDPRRRLHARVATSVAAGVAALALLGGSRWWRAVDAGYLRAMYRPLASTAVVTMDSAGRQTLRFTITDSLFYAGRTTPLMPDHGKLMHLFAVREPYFDVLAHLHPTRLDSARFDTPLPGLPPGRYRVFADVVHESGLARTLVAVTEVPPGLPRSVPKGFGSDGDDAWIMNGPAEGAAPMGDGLTLTWEGRGPFAARADTTLRFVLRDSAGRVVDVEPYMGMAAHAMVLREDGSVFVHLHPMGTISMAAQRRLLRREAGDTTLHGAAQPADTADHAGHEVTYPGTVGFPFAFPEPGAYRVWVQLRQGGRVRTAAFATQVR